MADDLPAQLEKEQLMPEINSRLLNDARSHNPITGVGSGRGKANAPAQPTLRRGRLGQARVGEPPKGLTPRNIQQRGIKNGA